MKHKPDNKPDNKPDKDSNYNFRIIILFLLISLSALLMYRFGIPCPQRLLTGVSCPGCGMTRAYIALFSGNVKEAFQLHPLFPVFPLILLLMLSERSGIISEKGCRTISVSVIILLLAVYIYRLMQPEDNVVVFSPAEGLLFRVLSYVYPFQ